MRGWIFTLAALPALWAADEQRLALALKAQSDFDRVAMASAPSLGDAARCVQSQAAVLAVSTRQELALFHHRRSYCLLAAAAISGNQAEFAEAAAGFDKAIAAWPERFSKSAKIAPEAVSSGLRVLAEVARLNAGGGAEDTQRAYDAISRAVDTGVCYSSVMPADSCEAVLRLGRRWAGWIALEADRLEEADRLFAGFASTGWSSWAAGKLAFRAGKFEQAASQYKQATKIWEATATESDQPLFERLAPPPRLAQAHTELGGAQLLAGNTAAAVETLNRAVREAPRSPWPLFLRARAREVAGEAEAASADYNLASRTAFASAQDLASGEAHLYRGILMFRRKDFVRAENEFASALNFEIPANLRADAAAWRHFAAVAAGHCEASREALENSLAAVSPYFPKQEARTAAVACRTVVTARPALPPEGSK